VEYGAFGCPRSKCYPCDWGCILLKRGKKGDKPSVDWQTLRLLVGLMQNSIIVLLRVDSCILTFFLFL